MKEAIELLSKPVKNNPHKVTIRKPAGCEAEISVRGQFKRHHLKVEDGAFTECGEYDWYWHPKNYLFGVCPECGYVNVPVQAKVKRSRRTSDLTRYRGQISRKAMAGVRGGMR